MRVGSDLSCPEKLTFVISEFFGTAIFMVIGCFGAAYNRDDEDTIMEAPVTFGFGILVAVQCFAHISGGHVNPLLSLSAILTGRISLVEGLFYFLGQFLGAIFGFGCLRLMLTRHFAFSSDDFKRRMPGFCLGIISKEIGEVESIFIEFAASLIFVMVFCGVWDFRNKDRTDAIALKIGCALLGLSLACVYWAGQVLGAVVGSLIYAIFFLKVEDEEE